ncbi:GDP-mannose 4,6-dehydratase [Curvibacter sp. CHRR-16]|uniref:GDP-mannose 4,6-dehydratase n=1 Tax=Curvibacter sp. CHRR-16 TaxID=2835872 RepID=UPI001BD96F8E|nr:GDP-mannose 4,6-dehydratase [Curvibacter sp. CHRR-16]MBT0571749.1 GDP-mannose 4,6-dehydratase [Curvibacter sp. CHRR-16]
MRALICGIAGQDGAYLAQLLLRKGYEVWGTSRDAQISTFGNLKTLGVADKIHLCSMAPTDFRSVLNAMVRSTPNEVYLLSGQSSVGLSFEQPVETLESISVATLNLLEAIRFLGGEIKLYNASSSECFGDVGREAANEMTPFRPRSPYAVAKASAHWMVANYRESYGLFAVNGILFNHESPLRHPRFVTRKIVEAALRIAAGSHEQLRLGRLDIVRDWGWAPEYVDAMWRMLQQDSPEDYVIATGVPTALKEFVRVVFDVVGLDAEKYVVSDPSFFRPSDIDWSFGDPQRAERQLGWRADVRMPDIAARLVEDLQKKQV